MTEIEFIDPGPAEQDEPPAPPPERAVRTHARLVPAVLWLVAGGLAAGAALGRLYSVDIRESGVRLTWSVDAWGRYSGTNEPFTVGHGPRTAILMLAGAALLLAAAATATLRHPAIATGLGIAGVAGTAAVASSLILEYLAMRETYEMQNREQDTGGNLVGSIVNISVRLGVATWLLAAAAACGLAALAASVLLGTRTRPEPEPEPGPGLG